MKKICSRAVADVLCMVSRSGHAGTDLFVHREADTPFLTEAVQHPHYP